jgi:type II secretory pathway predicted ATPase ExeA
MKIRNPKSEIRIFILILLLIFSFSALAQTADEYYNRAAKKYVMDDLEGAKLDLERALEIDPGHDKAQELLGVVVKELRNAGITPAPVMEPSLPSVTTTTLLVPGIRVIRPIIPAERAKFREAHQIFLWGEAYFREAEYLKAQDKFREVLDLLPGHEGASKYLEEIVEKLKELPPEAPVEMGVEVEEPSLMQKYLAEIGIGILILNALLTIFILIFIGLVVRIGMRWWRASHTYCPECGARNSKEAEFCKKCGARLIYPELTEEQREWFAKFGWGKNPFTLNIIPETFAGHQAEISIIVEKLNTFSGHILIIGGLGTGKTTLLQWLEKNLSHKFETIYVLRPPSRPDELIDLVSATITKKTTHTRKYTIYEFQELCKKYKRNILLLLDEAHEFNEEFEQFLRTLGDLPNIFLVMAGLPQAREKLKHDMPALFDRLVESILLGSLDLEETKELIKKRISNAGGKRLGPFTTGAIEKIYNLSYGIPRGILKICDWVLTQAVRANKTYIDVQDIAEYSEEIEEARAKEFEKIKEEKIGDE